ncbi:MAG: hypothetical protein M9883_01325, partial [Methylobacteriaceae bacterium]|nr:hypothetical protein [Methylobacteriaceae bacterium]
MRNSILVLPVLLALGGCASEAGPSVFLASADASTPQTMPVTGSDASLMLVQMPAPGGLVQSVREKTYPNGLNQQAVLAGAVP